MLGVLLGAGGRRNLPGVLFLSVHAVRRAEARGISRGEIAEAVAGAETTYRSDEDPSLVVMLGRTDAGRRLKVVVLASDYEYVITVADRDDER